VKRKSSRREFAERLVRAGIRVAPAESREWGRAILGELSCASSDWEALRWAIGGVGVLLENRIKAILFGDGAEKEDGPGADLSKTETVMRRIAFVTIGLCIAAMTLIFVAPAGRRAFQVSLAQWQSIFFAAGEHEVASQAARLEALAKRAEDAHDADGVAFAALHHPDEREGARLADRAVEIDSRLTWIYGVAATNDPYLPVEPWATKLKSYDPQNALPYFLTTERIDMQRVVRGEKVGAVNDETPDWKAAMAAAYESPTLDNYSSRMLELDRRVMGRYGWTDATVMQSEYDYLMPTYGAYSLPTYASWDGSIYAKSVMQSAASLDATGDRKGAAERLAAVARFGEMFSAIHARTSMAPVLREAYERLSALSAKDGNYAQAQLFSMYANRVDERVKSDKQNLEWVFASENVFARGANTVKIAGIVALLSAGVLVILGIVLITRLFAAGWKEFRVSRVVANLSAAAAAALLGSTVAIYLAYRPYAEILQAFIRTGDRRQLPELYAFLDQTSMALGAHANGVVPGRVFDFWLGVAVLGVVVSVVALARRIVHRSAGDVVI
jgi:hypothetical protein